MKKVCKICFVVCDAEMHEATVSLRAWFRRELLRKLEPLPLPPPKKKRVIMPINAIGYVPKELFQMPEGKQE